MAEKGCWIQHVETFINPSAPSDQQAASISGVTELLKGDRLTIEMLVREMQLYIISTDSIIRARGILFLAEVLTQLMSKLLDDWTVHSLVGFFTAKLEDWHSLHGAIIGCLALVKRKSDVGAVVASDARLLAEAFFKDVEVQSLALHDRKLCFELIQYFLDLHAVAVVPLGDILIYGICAAIDEEKDPGCLVMTFCIVERLAQLYQGHGSPLEGYAEEIFDILGRYFPIYFTHPESSDIGIKREELSRALMCAFGSTPIFEPYAMPLLLEKLSSSLPTAKLDSLKYITYCSQRYGGDKMKKYDKSLWSFLRDTVLTLSPEELFLQLDSVEDIKSSGNEVINNALDCLHTVAHHLCYLDDISFINMIVEDEILNMNLKLIIIDHDYSTDLSLSKQKLRALGSILSLCASVSIQCCNRLFEAFFSTFMDSLRISPEMSLSECTLWRDNVIFKWDIGALYLSIELLAACRDLAASLADGSIKLVPMQNMCFCLVKDFWCALTGVLQNLLEISEKNEFGKEYVFLAVKGLLILATFPEFFIAMPKAIYERILNIFVSIITIRFQEKYIWELSMKALIQIAAFAKKYNDDGKLACYMVVVVDEILMHLSPGADVPLHLLLDAIFGVCTVGITYMLRAGQKLLDVLCSNFVKALGDGDFDCIEVSLRIERCFSSHLLPWFLGTDEFEHVAMSFALGIWARMETSLVSLGHQEQDLLDVTMMAMKNAVAGCTPENQCLVIEKAYDVLLSTVLFQSQEIRNLSFPFQQESLKLIENVVVFTDRDEWIISLFASVLISLHPKTHLPNVRAIVKILVVAMFFKSLIPISQALGSLVNKWPVEDKMVEVPDVCTLDEALKIMLEMGLCNILDSSTSVDFGSSVLVNALSALGWIGKGLGMRGHVKLKEVLLLLLNYVLLSNEGTGTHADSVGLLQKTAADAFRTILSDSEDCLKKRFHATVRPLYKQHIFSTMMPILQSAAKKYDFLATKGSVYRALGYVISEAPIAAVIMKAKEVVPYLKEMLSILSSDASDKDLIYNLLLVLSGILTDDAGKEVILDNVQTVISIFINLVSFQNMMLVRETAIQCLVAMSELPYVQIYPRRVQVLEAITKALDDPKRAVRQEAVKCRQAWASLATRTLKL